MTAINWKAPVVCSKKIIVEAHPGQVWSRLADIANWSTWLTTVSTAQLNGPLEPNTTFDWKTGGMKIHSTLHTVNPNQQFGWTGKVYGIFAIHNWTFKAVGEHTQVEVSESMEGLLASLLQNWFNKTLERDMAKSLMLLKEACEKEVDSLLPC
ncbi:polyketide cyclase/dehydrase [Adhaeribacter arboris]|uniref:Polyketide cyclase/dehydrase n=1 Tax=Adhaeribacter arboris TaxID=2072846 RepID=A0A2T2YML7_9BACT|nr:SRPBCC family protein [Adhaeribacter arboris]PSR56752.1 polyketide cyclase/dehydrase [Adhaeribacter arboris]